MTFDKTEVDLSKGNADLNSCGSQQSEGPADDWDVAQLGHYARAQNQAIAHSERSLAPLYWRLGNSLNLAHRRIARGQWARFLEELGIERTRASKARAIQRTFTTEQELADLSVDEAYQRRQRKAGTKKGLPQPGQDELLDWLLSVCHRADFFLDEASFADRQDVASLLSTADDAIEGIERLRDRFRAQPPRSQAEDLAIVTRPPTGNSVSGQTAATDSCK